MGTVSIRETKPASIGGIPQQQYNNSNNMSYPQMQLPSEHQPMAGGMGMQPTGTWMNQRTGNLVTVDNMVNDMSQNGAQVMLSNGELISFSEFARDYIQVDDSNDGIDSNSNNDNNTVISEETAAPEPEFSLDRPLNNDTDINITDYLDITPVYNTTDNTNNIKQDNISKGKQMVIDLINNLSEMRSRKPEVEIESVIIKNIPREALSSLIKYFNVSVSDIVDIIFEKLIDKNIIKKCITDYINDVKAKSVKKSVRQEIKPDNKTIEN